MAVKSELKEVNEGLFVEILKGCTKVVGVLKSCVVKDGVRERLSWIFKG